MKFNQMALAASIGLLMSMSTASYAAQGLTSLTEDEMAAETGQALFNLSYISPTDSSNLMRNKTINGTSVGSVGFYKLGIEAEMELNANIKNLQLGCGGRNGPEACDIDIKNLSLSGLPNSYDGNGNPVFNNGRASTSAKLTNPFIEFAIKNPDTASTREVAGFRVSAEKISGLLTAGLANTSLPTADGIQSLSGFMRIKNTTGSVDTKETLFGNTVDQQIQGYIKAIGFDRTFISNPGSPDNKGITIPSIKNVNFSTPDFQVNGNRRTSASETGIKVKIPSIPMDAGPQNQLFVTFDPILLVASKAKFQMGAGSDVKNLNLDITFQQALSMIHNIPLQGTGGYLSLQSQPLLWPGVYVDSADSAQTNMSNMGKTDVAQPGWWMSFAEPVDLGKLQASEQVDISAVLPQVANLVTQHLTTEANRISIPFGDAIGSVFNTPIVSKLNIDLEAATSLNPAKVTLQNLQLKNQEIIPNCYGGLTFC